MNSDGYEFIETETVFTGLHWSLPGSLHLYYGFQFNIFYGIPQFVNELVSDSCAFPWILFLLLFHPILMFEFLLHLIVLSYY